MIWIRIGSNVSWLFLSFPMRIPQMRIGRWVEASLGTFIFLQMFGRWFDFGFLLEEVLRIQTLCQRRPKLPIENWGQVWLCEYWECGILGGWVWCLFVQNGQRKNCHERRLHDFGDLEITSDGDFQFDESGTVSFKSVEWTRNPRLNAPEDWRKSVEEEMISPDWTFLLLFAS